MNEFKTFNKDSIQVGNFKLNDKQKNNILNILRNAYETYNVSFRLFNKDFLCGNILKKYGLFCITEVNSKNGKETYMFHYVDDKYKCIFFGENGSTSVTEEFFQTAIFFQNQFDYYKIIIE